MRRRRVPALAAVVIGVGLALAPVGFRMFERAPKGGHMITGFKPYMRVAKINSFRSELAVIGAARNEVVRLPAGEVGNGPTARFVKAWPGIDSDMGSMLTTMQSDIGHYRGVAELPPFVLFPWFFVIPGALIVAVGLFVRRPAPWLAALGVGLLAAPAVFQMFTRAPGGASMIDDFKPFMTTAKVTRIQGYFLTIGGAEAELRHTIVPAQPSGALPAVDAFNRQWPAISADMAPMIGAMADNVGNFGAVAALPPFGLFPWFFVGPGAALAGLALADRVARRRGDAAERSPTVEVALEGAVR